MWLVQVKARAQKDEACLQLPESMLRLQVGLTYGPRPRPGFLSNPRPILAGGYPDRACGSAPARATTSRGRLTMPTSVIRYNIAIKILQDVLCIPPSLQRSSSMRAAFHVKIRAVWQVNCIFQITYRRQVYHRHATSAEAPTSSTLTGIRTSCQVEADLHVFMI